jgi:hypothetical protein
MNETKVDQVMEEKENPSFQIEISSVSREDKIKRILEKLQIQ